MKKLQCLLAAVIIAGSISAMDSFDSFDSFDDFGGGFSSFGGSGTETGLEISGNLTLENRLMFSDDKSQSKADLMLDLSYARDYSDFYTRIKVDGEGNIDLDEAYVRLYYDNFILDVGRIKNVWGKGDMIHPVDFMNAMDMSDLMSRDYADRNIAQDMIKLTYRGEGDSRYIFAWAPNFRGNTVELRDGHMFTPRAVQNIYDNMSQDKRILGEDILRKGLEPDNNIKNSQFALRYTDTKGRTDFGFTLYRGFDKNANILALSNDKADLYTEKYSFGAEFSRVLGGVNTRGEFVYNYTEDFKGTDPLVPNNSVELLLGFDRDLGISNVNLNMQLLTTYLVNADEAEDNLKLGYDANTSLDGKVHSLKNMLVVSVTDKYKNDTINPEAKLVYQVDDSSFILTNLVEFKLRDDIGLTTGYTWIYGDNNSTFGQYNKADHAFIKFEYNF